MWDALTLETASKAVVYLATLVYLGAVTAAASAPPRRDHPLHRLAATVARSAGALGIAALAARALLHGLAASDGVFDAETTRVVLLESRWGGRWQWQFAAAVAATAVALTRGLSRGAWGGPALAALAWCAATPLLGHGASTTWQHGTHAAHLVVTGAWLGTVAVLALAARRGSAIPLDELAPAIARFSPWALVCASAAAASGAVLALTYLGPVVDGLASPYGRWLLLKLVLVGAAGGCGFVNWRRTRAGQCPARGVLHAEALAAMLTAAVTAVLSETAHPGD